MILILKIKSYRDSPVSNAAECRLSGTGGTIGRALENDLVLEDPGKQISRVHAKVLFRAGSYFLEDVGSNPSVVNDQPLGKGREVSLSQGDRIAVGDHVLEVRLETAVVVAVIAPSPFNDAALPLFEPPPAPVSAPLLPLPVPAGWDGAAPSPALSTDAFAGAKILDVLAGFPLSPGASTGSGSGAASFDPLGLNLGQGAGQSPSGTLVPASVSASAAALWPVPVPFQSPSRTSAAFLPLPPVTRVAMLAIPDDYDPLADFFPPVPVAVPVTVPAPASVQAAAVMPLALQVAPPAAVAPQRFTPMVREIEDRTVMGAALPTLAIPTPLPVPTRLRTAPAAVAVEPPGTPSHSGNPSSDDSAVLQALLRGLGLPDLRLKGSAVELAETVGALLRAATGGTMNLLLARTLTKKESRVDTTMIAVRSNNPLKFFPNSESALTQLLTNAMAGYLAPVPAMEGAFADLKAHELAVMVGTRAALEAVLQRFDPAQIDAQLALPTGMDKLLGANRKVRLWDRWVEAHGALARESDDLQRLYGEHFSAAYEDQIERLRLAGA